MKQLQREDGHQSTYFYNPSLRRSSERSTGENFRTFPPFQIQTVYAMKLYFYYAVLKYLSLLIFLEVKR